MRLAPVVVVAALVFLAGSVAAGSDWPQWRGQNRDGKSDETGLLKHVDLANRGSAIAVQTEDLGVATEAGFEVLGRVPAAEARGCSLALDQLLGGTRHD